MTLLFPVAATTCSPFQATVLLHGAETPCVMAVCRKWYASNRPPGQPLQEPDVLLQKDIPSKKVIAASKLQQALPPLLLAPAA